MSNNHRRVLIVEDDPFTRALVADALRGADYEVVVSDSVHAAMGALAADDFHAVVSDLDLGAGPSGVDLLTRIAEDSPWMGMVALTSHASPELAVGAGGMLPEATVYLVKSELRDIRSLTVAVEQSLAGEGSWLARDDSDDSRSRVTMHQAEVLRMLSAGLSTSGIAEHRRTSVRAAEMMIQRLYDKLGLKSAADIDPRTGAVLMWQQGRVRVR